jgi:hypothetical protein
MGLRRLGTESSPDSPLEQAGFELVVPPSFRSCPGRPRDPPRGQIHRRTRCRKRVPAPAPVIPERLSPLSRTRVEEHNHTVVAIVWVPGLFTSNYGVSAY